MRPENPIITEELEEKVVEPNFFIELEEYGNFSTRDNVTIDGVSYEKGNVVLKQIEDWTFARFDLWFGDDIDSVLNGDWRGTSCKVGIAGKQPFVYLQEGYFEEDYADYAYEATSILLFVGELAAAPRVGSWVEFEAQEAGLNSTFTPRERIEPPLFNHLPPRGKLVKFDGEIFILEPRRSD